MVHELLGTTNNKIDLSSRDDVAEELKQLTLSATTDEFYRHNMYANFGEIGQTIQKLVQNFQEKVKIYCILGRPMSYLTLYEVPSFHFIKYLYIFLHKY